MLADHSSIDILVNAAGVLRVHRSNTSESAADAWGLLSGFVDISHHPHTLPCRHDAKVRRGPTAGCAWHSSAVQAMCIGVGRAASSIMCGTSHVLRKPFILQATSQSGTRLKLMSCCCMVAVRSWTLDNPPSSVGIVNELLVHFQMLDLNLHCPMHLTRQAVSLPTHSEWL